MLMQGGNNTSPPTAARRLPLGGPGMGSNEAFRFSFLLFGNWTDSKVTIGDARNGLASRSSRKELV